MRLFVFFFKDEEEQGEKDSESDSIKAVIQKAAMEEPEIKPDLKGLTWSEKQDGDNLI